MHAASAPTTLAFTALVLAVSGLFVFGTFRAGRHSGEAPARTRAWTALAALVLAVTLGGSFALAVSGALRDFSSTPPPLMRLIAAVTLVTTALATSPFGARLARGLPVAALVGFQAFRVGVELALFALYREGVIPVQMTFEGWNFDVLSGLSAIVVAYRSHRGRLSPLALLLWNIAGLALLAVIVVIANLSAPTPFRAFHEGPANTIIAEAPFVWLPVLLVQAALFGHLLVFRRLRASAGPPIVYSRAQSLEGPR